jgi:hypothetical protein
MLFALRLLVPRSGGALAGLAAAAICSIGSAETARAQAPQNPGYPGVTSPYTPSPNPPLEAGGLRPPTSSMPSSARSESETIEQLERAEREDAGRGLEFFWVDVEGGYEYASLRAFRSDALLGAGAVEDSGSGLALGVGAGVRVIFLTFGGRLRLMRASAWDLWTLDAEVGLHLPIGALEPSFTFAAGYAWLGAPNAEGTPGFDAGAVDVSGVNARLGANLDYYVNPLLSFGARASFEALALWRAGAAQPAAVPAEVAESYAQDGDGIGFGVTLGATAGLHF